MCVQIMTILLHKTASTRRKTYANTLTRACIRCSDNNNNNDDDAMAIRWLFCVYFI